MQLVSASLRCSLSSHTNLTLELFCKFSLNSWISSVWSECFPANVTINWLHPTLQQPGTAVWHQDSCSAATLVDPGLTPRPVAQSPRPGYCQTLSPGPSPRWYCHSQVMLPTHIETSTMAHDQLWLVYQCDLSITYYNYLQLIERENVLNQLVCFLSQLAVHSKNLCFLWWALLLMKHIEQCWILQHFYWLISELQDQPFYSFALKWR